MLYPIVLRILVTKWQKKKTLSLPPVKLSSCMYKRSVNCILMYGWSSYPYCKNHSGKLCLKLIFHMTILSRVWNLVFLVHTICYIKLYTHSHLILIIKTCCVRICLLSFVYRSVTMCAYCCEFLSTITINITILNVYVIPCSVFKVWTLWWHVCKVETDML